MNAEIIECLDGVDLVATIADCEWVGDIVTITYIIDSRRIVSSEYIWKPYSPKSLLVHDIQLISDVYLPLSDRRECYIDTEDVLYVVGDCVVIMLEVAGGQIYAKCPRRRRQLPVKYYRGSTVLCNKILDVIAYCSLRGESIAFTTMDAIVGKYIETEQVKDAVMDLFLRGLVKISKCGSEDDRMLYLSDKIGMEP